MYSLRERLLPPADPSNSPSLIWPPTDSRARLPVFTLTRVLRASYDLPAIFWLAINCGEIGCCFGRCRPWRLGRRPPKCRDSVEFARGRWQACMPQLPKRLLASFYLHPRLPGAAV